MQRIVPCRMRSGHSPGRPAGWGVVQADHLTYNQGYTSMTREQGSCLRVWSTSCPRGSLMPRATALHLHRVEPGLVSQVLADTDLILPAKLALLYLLSHSQQIHTREDLAAVDPTVAERLDAVLHELASRLATVPAEEPPCLATRFRLRPHRERSEEHTSELQSRPHLVCRLLLET